MLHDYSYDPSFDSEMPGHECDCQCTECVREQVEHDRYVAAQEARAIGRVCECCEETITAERSGFGWRHHDCVVDRFGNDLRTEDFHADG